MSAGPPTHLFWQSLTSGQLESIRSGFFVDRLSRESFDNGFAELLRVDLTKRGPVLSASRIFALEQNVRPFGMTADAAAAATGPLQVGERAGVEVAHQEAGALSPACAIRAQIQSEQ